MRDPRALTVRNSLVALCATFLHPASLAHGDLYTDGVLSLEWLVDSSDEILLVHIGPLAADGQPTVNRQSALKTHKVGSRWSSDQSFIEKRRWAVPVRGLRVEEDEDWLLFVRATHPDNSASRQVFHGINLTQPLKSYSTAAITREGKPLVDRQTILDAVDARVQLNRRLPPHADYHHTRTGAPSTSLLVGVGACGHRTISRA